MRKYKNIGIYWSDEISGIVLDDSSSTAQCLLKANQELIFVVLTTIFVPTVFL